MSKSIVKGKLAIVAEIAQSYEGNVEVLLALCEKLGHTGVDGVMFQVVKADELATPENNNYAFFKSLEFSRQELKEVIERIHQHRKAAVAEVFGVDTARLMAELGINGIKIHPADLANLPFLDFVGRLGLPLIVGVGATYLREIEIALDAIKRGRPPEIVLMHGYQTCPTPLNQSHLLKIKKLKSVFGLPVGYSDHVPGSLNGNIASIDPAAYYLPLVAIALGAVVIEKHVMLNRNKKWEDYESAITPEELDRFVGRVRAAELALGDPSLDFNEAEKAYRLTAKKYVIAARDLPEGHRLREEDIGFKRIVSPLEGIVNGQEIVGKSLKKAVKTNEPITFEKLMEL